MRDRKIGKTLAVKVLKEELVADTASVKRFEKEAKAAAEMSHPNLVDVYGHGELADKVPYLIMDYIEGIDLSQILQNGPLDCDRSVKIFLQSSFCRLHRYCPGLASHDRY